MTDDVQAIIFKHGERKLEFPSTKPTAASQELIQDITPKARICSWTEKISPNFRVINQSKARRERCFTVVRMLKRSAAS